MAIRERIRFPYTSNRFEMKKNILLIGGSHGIGLAIAKQLHTDHNLYIASRTKEGLEHLDVHHIPFDVLEDELELTTLPRALDGFVYCPGSIVLKPFRMMDIATFRDDMNLNFFGLVKVASAIQGRMNEGSNMLFFSTAAVSTGMPFHTSIAAAKGAIEGFARAMAAEYAPGIRVNVIAPSLVDTPLAARLINTDAKKGKMEERHPLKRVGMPSDIANLAVFLLCQENHWITGQVFGVDGGISTLNTS